MADQPLLRRGGRGWGRLPRALLESPRRGRRSRGSTGGGGSPGSSWVRRGRHSTRNPSSHGGHCPGGGEGGQWVEALAWREKSPGRRGAQDSRLGRPPASLKDKTSIWASSTRTALRRDPAPGQAGAWGHLRGQEASLGSAQPAWARGPAGGPTVPKDTPSPVRPASLGVWESQPPRVRAQAQAGGSLPEVRSHWAPALPLCGLSPSGPGEGGRAERVTDTCSHPSDCDPLTPTSAPLPGPSTPKTRLPEPLSPCPFARAARGSSREPHFDVPLLPECAHPPGAKDAERAGSAPTTDLSHPPSGPVVQARSETRSQNWEGADRTGGALGGHRGGGTLAKTEILKREQREEARDDDHLRAGDVGDSLQRMPSPSVHTPAAQLPHGSTGPSRKVLACPDLTCSHQGRAQPDTLTGAEDAWSARGCSPRRRRSDRGLAAWGTRSIPASDRG